MLKTITSFRKHLRDYYNVPGTEIISVRGVNAVMFSDKIKMSSEDVEKYHPIFVLYKRCNWQIVFLGIPKALLPQSQEEIIKLLATNFTAEGVYDTPLPQTYAAAERWFKRHDVKYNDRSFVSSGEVAATLNPLGHTSTSHNASIFKDYKGPWFMYELNIEDAETKLIKVPYIEFEPLNDMGRKTQMILVKAPSNKYSSIKQKMRTALVNQITSYEKIIAFLATSQYDKAATAANTYMSLLFERQGTVDIEDLKEAYAKNNVYGFTQNPCNLKSSPEQMQEIEDMRHELHHEIDRLCPGGAEVSTKHETSFEEEAAHTQSKLKNMQEIYNKRERLDDVPGIGVGELQDDDD